MLINQAKEIINSKVRSLHPSIQLPEYTIEYPADARFGDLTTNAALVLSGVVKQSPRDIANGIAEEMQSDEQLSKWIDSVEVAGPGFINIKVKSEVYWKEAGQYILNKFHRDKPEDGMKVMVEYSSPNIAKPFNVGHLRSTIIGDSIARLHEHLGAEVIRDNHIGDWGTQYGKLAYAVEQWGDWEKIERNPITELYKLYVQFHAAEDTDQSLTEKGREYFKRLESGDPDVINLWEKLVALSMKEFDSLYKYLDVAFDMQLGESYYEPKLAEVIDECKTSGIARESEGALLIFFDNDPVLKDTPLMIRKSNGTSTYGTRDLAGVKYRMRQFSLDKLILEVGNDQRHYFKQVIRASEMLGWVQPGQLIHIGHGLLSLPTGKMSTRKGRTVDIKELIVEIEEKAYEVLDDRQGISKEEKKQIAKDIAIGALKYNDLSQNRNSDIVFSKDKALSLEGNSAPYLQYIVARSNGILNSANLDISSEHTVHELVQEALQRDEMLTTQERDLLSFAMRFDSVTLDAANGNAPHVLANYLFQLCQKFNSFYHACPVLQAPDEIQKSRLLAVALTREHLMRGLYLLGIKTPKRM